MGIGIGMLAIWSEHKRKSQLLEQNHRERMHAIEKGIELPPLPANLVGVSNGPSTASRPPSRCAAASCWLLIGIVLFFAHRQWSARSEGALFGLIPAAIGLANLVYAAILWNKEQGATREVARATVAAVDRLLSPGRRPARRARCRPRARSGADS